MIRPAIERKVSADFPDNGRKLESVAAKAAAQNDVRMGGMPIDDEVSVGRICIHAGGRALKGAGRARHPFIHRLNDRGYVAVEIDLPIQILRVANLSCAMEGRFYSIAKIGKSVERRDQASPIEQE